MADALPGDFGQVNQPVRPAEVDKGAEVGQADDMPGADFALLQFLQQAFLLAFAGFLGGRPFGKDQAVPAAVDFDHLDADRFADHPAPLLVDGFALAAVTARKAELGRRDKTAEIANLDDQSAFVEPVHASLVDFLAGAQIFRLLPVGLLLGPRQGKHNVAVVIFRHDDVDEDFLPFLELFAGVGREPFQFPGRDDAFGLGADGNEDFRRRHPRDGSLADFALLGNVGSLGFLQKLVHGGVVALGFGVGTRAGLLTAVLHEGIFLRWLNVRHYKGYPMVLATATG